MPGSDGRGRKLSPEDKEKIWRLRVEEGLSAAVLAARFSCSEYQVRRVFEEHRRKEGMERFRSELREIIGREIPAEDRIGLLMDFIDGGSE